MRKRTKINNVNNQNNKTNTNKKTIITTIAIIATIAVIAIATMIFTNKTNNINELEDETIRIPIQELSTTAQFFEEEIDNVKIKYFAVKDDDGDVKTAFDACDVCYNSKKGYTQDGEYMICNNCGNKYHVSGLGTENKRGGGCWPSYLESNIENGELVIKKTSLEEGAYKFN
jgi:uncharacterized membrane protein